MKKEIRYFFAALMFLTRLPTPKFADHDQAHLENAPKYFPLIGWMVGALSVAAFLVFNRLVGLDVGVLASIITGILTTGAFHEDGFADMCDAMGGGWTKDKILNIMKDSRLGTYGVVGLICMLAAKFYLLKELPGFMPKDLNAATNPLLNYRYFIGLVLAAHSLSRWMSVSVIQQYAYVTSDDGSKSKPLASQKLSIVDMIVASIFACLPLLLLPYQIALAIVPMFWVRMEMANWFKKWIGGYTGDCLGAVQQVTEIIFYLSAIIIWRFI